jgi:predicted aconitase with swiveling domain
LAPTAPYVYTGSFVQASISSATFKGTVNPHGAETLYAFQYGLTSGYGAQTAPARAGNSTADVKVSGTISGLQPGTTYHCRLIATNADGTTNGADVVFATKARRVPLKASIAATPDPVVFGDPFSVSGVLTGTEAAGHTLVLQATPFPYLGAFTEVASPIVADAGGKFSFSVANLLKNTELRVAGAGASTVGGRAIIERVAVRVSLHLRSTGRHGRVRMYGAVEPSEVGASVSLQLLRAGRAPRSIARTRVGRAGPGISRFSRIVRIHRRGLYRAWVQINNGMQVSGASRTLLIR